MVVFVGIKPADFVPVLDPAIKSLSLGLLKILSADAFPHRCALDIEVVRLFSRIGDNGGLSLVDHKQNLERAAKRTLCVLGGRLREFGSSPRIDSRRA